MPPLGGDLARLFDKRLDLTHRMRSSFGRAVPTVAGASLVEALITQRTGSRVPASGSVKPLASFRIPKKF